MIDTNSDRYSLRLKNIRQAITKTKVDAFLITDMINIHYLTGFTGSYGCAFITAKDHFFITDFRYREQSENEVMGWDILIEKGNRIALIQDISKKNGIKKLGFESSVSYHFFRKLSHISLRLKAMEGFVEKLREIKDRQEIHYIQEAVMRSENAFMDVKNYIRPGISERSIALRLEEALMKRGCSRIPFDIIVASGPHSAMPHARPTDRKLQKGDLVIADWGGEAHGYFSDMTRTFLLKGGNNIQKKKEIYHTVLEANRRAVSSVSNGALSKQIDAGARDYIKNAGYGDLFGHGTGHGVGLQVHESPRISWNKSEPVRKNMVFTIEPGIYLPGLGGVRIEDMVVVSEKKAEVLTSLPKKLELI
ncbi:MAG: aminopeptidase P family protein [Nitrospira sp.]|nr:aminopeptidase P family protein [Nitrospira sp.]